MYRIAKTFTFSASHQMPLLPPTHRCARLHGHNYTVEVELQSETLDAYGFVRDYGELNSFKEYIAEQFDHRHLNDVMGDDKTTAEHLARHFYDFCKKEWPQTSAVRVYETNHTWAEYRP